MAEKERCRSCDGERVLWLMSEFPIPCPDCNENSPEFKRKKQSGGSTDGHDHTS